jgi:hypothetical protein
MRRSVPILAAVVLTALVHAQASAQTAAGNALQQQVGGLLYDRLLTPLLGDRYVAQAEATMREQLRSAGPAYAELLDPGRCPELLTAMDSTIRGDLQPALQAALRGAGGRDSVAGLLGSQLDPAKLMMYALMLDSEDGAETAAAAIAQDPQLQQAADALFARMPAAGSGGWQRLQPALTHCLGEAAR